MSALPAQRGSGRRGSIFHGVLLLVGPRQQLDFATHPIKKRVEVSGRLGLKSLGVDGKPFNPWHVDCYARGREATAPAGNEARN